MDLVIFAEENTSGKLHFLCSENSNNSIENYKEFLIANTFALLLLKKMTCVMINEQPLTTSLQNNVLET